MEKAHLGRSKACFDRGLSLKSHRTTINPPILGPVETPVIASIWYIVSPPRTNNRFWLANTTSLGDCGSKNEFVTVRVCVLKTTTKLDALFAMYAFNPSGEKARLVGLEPTNTLLSIASVFVSMIATEFWDGIVAYI